MYRDPTGSGKGLEALNEICSRIPVSVIFGGENDLMYVLEFHKCTLHDSYITDHILCKMPSWIALLVDIFCLSTASKAQATWFVATSSWLYSLLKCPCADSSTTTTEVGESNSRHPDRFTSTFKK